MKVKKVNRYYCDFCKKSGCSKFHILKHEKYCTLNPNRECRMCKILDDSPVAMSELVKVLPRIEDYKKEESKDLLHSYSYYEGFTENVNEALSKLRLITGDCPACILAAIRQAKIPVPMIEKFDYKKEVELFWEKINSDVGQ